MTRWSKLFLLLSLCLIQYSSSKPVQDKNEEEAIRIRRRNANNDNAEPIFTQQHQIFKLGNHKPPNEDEFPEFSAVKYKFKPYQEMRQTSHHHRHHAEKIDEAEHHSPLVDTAELQLDAERVEQDRNEDSREQMQPDENQSEDYLTLETSPKQRHHEMPQASRVQLPHKAKKDQELMKETKDESVSNLNVEAVRVIHAQEREPENVEDIVRSHDGGRKQHQKMEPHQKQSHPEQPQSSRVIQFDNKSILEKKQKVSEEAEEKEAPQHQINDEDIHAERVMKGKRRRYNFDDEMSESEEGLITTMEASTIKRETKEEEPVPKDDSSISELEDNDEDSMDTNETVCQIKAVMKMLQELLSEFLHKLEKKDRK